MAKEKKQDNLRKFIKKWKESEGLPDGISTEAQLWDEIFKKEAYIMQEQFFPLIREIHGKIYQNGTSVNPLATEYPIERVSTKEITSVRSDITVRVGEQAIYHFECEISYDKHMVLRMLEYDTHIALEYPGFSPVFEQSRTGLDVELSFPYSAVIYLQDNKNIPDNLSCKIRFPDGAVYEYKVPALCVQSYTLEEIQEKHLNVLIPFLPLRFRKYLPPRRKMQIKNGELTSFYQAIILILEKEVSSGFLKEDSRKAILSFLRKSMVRVFYKYETLFEEVIQLTEPILELECEKIERLERQYQESIAKLTAQKDAELFQKDEALSQKDEEIAILKKMLWVLQNPQNGEKGQ